MLLAKRGRPAQARARLPAGRPVLRPRDDLGPAVRDGRRDLPDEAEAAEAAVLGFSRNLGGKQGRDHARRGDPDGFSLSLNAV